MHLIVCFQLILNSFSLIVSLLEQIKFAKEIKGGNLHFTNEWRYKNACIRREEEQSLRYSGTSYNITMANMLVTINKRGLLLRELHNWFDFTNEDSAGSSYIHWYWATHTRGDKMSQSKVWCLASLLICVSLFLSSMNAHQCMWIYFSFYFSGRVWCMWCRERGFWIKCIQGNISACIWCFELVLH